MSYRLRCRESVAAGLRRVVRAEINAAIREMTDARIDRHEAIHQARKRLKKVRAVLRLIRPVAPAIFAAENPSYRDMGRDLSPVRDATTAIEAIESLGGRFKDQKGAGAAIGRAREVFVARRDRVVAAAGDDARLAQQFVEGLNRARERVAAWTLPRGGFPTISPGLKQSFAQGRESLRRACAEPTAGNLHELRKRAKDHWYHARLLECVWPEPMRCYRDAISKLADLLGDDHDLTLVRCVVAGDSAAFGREEARTLTRLIDRRQEELRAEALGLARRVYAEKPKALRRRLEAYWEAMLRDTNAPDAPDREAQEKTDGKR